MKKIYFCKRCDYVPKKLYKKVKKEFPYVKVKRADCIAECSTCKHYAFSLIDGIVVKSDNPKGLYEKLKKLHY
jgi:uncharacterized protein YuzB (UPF0349 family)